MRSGTSRRHPGPLAGVAAPTGGFHPAPIPTFPGLALGSVCWITPRPPLPSLPQLVHHLENTTKNMLAKVHAGQKVTALDLAVQDILKNISSSSSSPCKGKEMPQGLRWWEALLAGLVRSSCSLHPWSQHSGDSGVRWGDALWLPVSQELGHLPPHLDLLCRMAQLYHTELQHMEHMASDALKSVQVTKVKWSGAPQGPLPLSRAHRRHNAPALLSLPALQSKSS